MRRTSYTRLFALVAATAMLTAALAATSPRAAADASFAIVNARIVDGTGAAPFDGTIVVRDGRIATVERATGPNAQPPAGLPTIDGQGRTVTPGLFDLHVHLFARASNPLTPDVAKHLAAYLYCGVTSIAELGTDPESFQPLREMLSAGRMQGPHVNFAARMAVPGGHGAEAGRADLHTALVVTERDAHAAIRRIAPYQPDLIKVFADGWRYDVDPNLPSMVPPTLAAIASDARTRHLPVFTHTVTAAGARDAAESGVTVLAHGIGDEDASDPLAKLLRDRDMTYVSTLSVYEPREHRQITPLLWKVLEPAARQRLERPAPAAAADTLTARQRRWAHLLKNVRTLRAAGVRIGVGTDAGMPSAPHGWSTLLELRLLVEGGLTPMEALTAATGQSAAALGVQADRGTIAPGQRADLLLVPGDPTTDVARMEQVERVFVDGREVDRPALEAMMTSPALSPLTPVAVSDPLIDDFEGDDDRSDRGARWMNQTEAGPHTTRMVYDRVQRAPRDHALRMSAHMSDDASPFARVWLALTRGSLQPVDIREFSGVRFDARGEGTYTFVATTRAVRDGRYFETTFRAEPVWMPIAIRFDRLAQPGKGSPTPWTGDDLLELAFELARDPGTGGWLEIDNVRFERTIP